MYALALMVKETAVILPVLVLAHARLYPFAASGTPEEGRARTVIRTVLPYLVLTAVYLVERSLVLSPAGSSSGRIEPLTGIQAMMSTWPVLLSGSICDSFAFPIRSARIMT